MKVISPTLITPARLISSSVPETDYPEWAAGTAYTAGQRVIVADERKCYEALASTTGEQPRDTPLAWLDLGATNRWRALDQKVGTTTAATGSITYTFAPGIVNGVALLNMGNALTARIKMTDAVEGVVYDKTIDLYDPSNVTDLWAYFFEDIRLRTTSVVIDLPTYRNPTVEITLTGPSGDTVSIGSLVLGKLHDYGYGVREGAATGIQSFSRKERDEFGNFAIAPRGFAKRATWSLVLNNSEIDVFQERMTALSDTPAVYIGDPRFASTVVYGFYRDFNVVIPYPNHSECSLEIEGLV